MGNARKVQTPAERNLARAYGELASDVDDNGTRCSDRVSAVQIL